MSDDGFKKVECPHCGKELLIPQNARELVCMYCAVPIDAQDLLAHTESAAQKDFEELLTEAKRLFPDTVVMQLSALKEFNAQNYEPLYNEYAAKLAPACSVFTRAAGIHPEKAAEQMGTWLFDRNLEDMQEKGILKEGDSRFFDVRYAIVAFLIPALADYGPETDALADFFLSKWNARYPKNPLGKSTFAAIRDGFRKKLCFISTAVCGIFGKPDDCPELMALRGFRDGFLRNAANGERKIKEYYLFAPMIVRAIDQRENRAAIYGEIWHCHLRPCLEDIAQIRPEECARRYEEMMRGLESRFLY